MSFAEEVKNSMKQKPKKEVEQRIYSNIANSLFAMAKAYILTSARNGKYSYKNGFLGLSNKKVVEAFIGIDIRNYYDSPEIALDNDNEMAIMGAIVRDYDDYLILYNEIKKLCIKEGINIGDIETKIKSNSTGINIWIEI